MAGWTIKYPHVSGDVSIAVSSRNVSGSGLVSADVVTDRAEGCAVPIAGVYRFTMESANTVSVTTVHAHDAGNPLVWSGTRSITADGATENLNLLPGIAVVIAAGAEAGDVFEIGIGCWWDSGNSTWVRPLPIGPCIPGRTRTGISLIAINDSGYTLSSCRAVVTNAARVENDVSVSRPFYSFRQTGALDPTADADLDGQAVTFANVGGGLADILIDGAAIDVYDVTNETLIPDGEGLEADNTTVYRFADGTALQSVEFVLSASLAGTDTATIYVSDGGESVQIADSGGTYVSGPTGIDLTEDGQATGVVTTEGEVEFSIRLSPAVSEDGDLNPRAFSLRISSSKV